MGTSSIDEQHGSAHVGGQVVGQEAAASLDQSLLDRVVTCMHGNLCIRSELGFCAGCCAQPRGRPCSHSSEKEHLERAVDFIASRLAGIDVPRRVTAALDGELPVRVLLTLGHVVDEIFLQRGDQSPDDGEVLRWIETAEVHFGPSGKI